VVFEFTGMLKALEQALAVEGGESTAFAEIDICRFLLR
jgi:hypothetical protein